MSVPRTWRTRVAIVWGNGGHRVFHTLRFPRCGDDASGGNAYAGGFFLRKPSGCVPLRFTVGAGTSSVRRAAGAERAGPEIEVPEPLAIAGYGSENAYSLLFGVPKPKLLYPEPQ